MKKKKYRMLFLLMTAGLICGCGVIWGKANRTGESGQKKYILASELEEREAPTALLYSEEGEGHNEWQITDAATINACMQALKQIAITKETELRATDSEERLVFQMSDGSTWTLEFEAGNLLRNGSCYETEGWKEVQKILQDYLTKEGMR